MKSLHDYLKETQKTYTYRVSVARRLKESELSDVKTLLARFDVQSVTDLKHLPVQDNHPDFPSLGPIESSCFMLVIKYPTITDVIQDILAKGLNLVISRVLVRTLVQDMNMSSPKQHDSALLTQDLDIDKELAKLGTQQQVDDLKKSHQSRKMDFASKDTAKMATTDDLPIGKTSPIGTKKNKLPDVKSAAR